MYLLFKSVDARSLGIIQLVGSYMYFSIGYLPDTHKDIIDYRHLNAIVISEGVAKAWKFLGAHRGLISVRAGTPQNVDLQVIRSEEATGEKVKYTLTDEDKLNTTELHKYILKLILDETFDKRLIEINLTVSQLESSSWPQQKYEAENYPDQEPILLKTLADARKITIEEMVQKVLNAIETYNKQVFDLLVKKQTIEQEIKNCTSIGECNILAHYKFGIEMPIYQRQEIGIDTSATFTI